MSDPTSPKKSPLLALFVLGASLWSGIGCGDSQAVLRIQLNTLQGDNAFTGVAEIEVLTWVDEALIAQSRGPLGPPITLPPTDRGGQTVVEIRGFDATDTLLSIGRAQPDSPERGEECCVVVCFCTQSVFDAGECGCGSNLCRAVCSVE